MATFDEYLAARRVTDEKASNAKTAVTAEETARAAVDNASATLEAAEGEKASAFDEWQVAERAENAIAEDLGIDPRNPDPDVPSEA